MSGNCWNAILVAAGMTLFMTVLPPALIGGAEGSAWAFVKEFQTLITGILAVSAAFITIRQMQVADSNSDRRHVELLQLSLRSDRRRVHRMMRPWGAVIPAYLRNLKKEAEPFFAAQTEDDRRALLTKNWEAVETKIVDIVELFDHPSFVDARDLYSPKVAWDIWSIKENLTILRGMVDGATRLQLVIDGQAIPTARAAVDALTIVLDAVDDLVVDLKEMAAEFDLVIRDE